MKDDDASLKHFHEGTVQSNRGETRQARFYLGDGEECPQDRESIGRDTHTTWEMGDGTIGIRRGTAVSVGASRSYSTKYDDVDWGN